MAKQGKIYIMGHKNPDTDSICSAIAYADIKNRSGDGRRYMAKRAGQINRETEYVLKRFGAWVSGRCGDTGERYGDQGDARRFQQYFHKGRLGDHERE